MYSKTQQKTSVPNPRALKESWMQGPIGDKSLTPGHGRPVYSFSIGPNSVKRFFA